MTKHVKISWCQITDKILVKQRKRNNKLTTSYKSEPFTVIKNGKNTVKIRDAYGKERVWNVANVLCFWGRSDSLHKVSKSVWQDKANNDFTDETIFSETEEWRQDQDQRLWISTRQKRMTANLSDYWLSWTFNSLLLSWNI